MGRTVRTEFAAWLRAQLQSQGWMVADFAQRVGVRPSAVYRWTSGQRAPTDSQVAGIAEALGIPPAEIWEALARSGVTPSAPPATSAERPRRPEASAGPPPTERPFSRWLRSQLAERGWSGGFLARKLDLDPVTVRAWLNGVRSPAAVQFPRIAATFGVDVATVRDLVEQG